MNKETNNTLVKEPNTDEEPFYLDLTVTKQYQERFREYQIEHIITGSSDLE